MPTLNTEAFHYLWSDPAVSSRIDADIGRHRKANLALRVIDAAGNPVPGVCIESIQTDADFHFGANIFMLGGYPTPELNARYEEAYLALFNAATVPFYWRGLEPERGKPRYAPDSAPFPRRPPPDAVIAFCERHGLRMHGHTLLWDFFQWSAPDWLSKTDASENSRLWEAHVREIATRYGKRIHRWDALNESLCSPDRVAKGLSCPMPADYEREAFKWAEESVPSDTRLDINETTHVWSARGILDYAAQIRSLLNRGTSIGGAGLQFHLFADANLVDVIEGKAHRPGDLFRTLDTLAPLGLPLHISEITLTSPGNDAAGQAAQAEVARNFYRLWFSHPSVDSITWWNVPDGGAAPGEDKVASGLLNRDLTPKPAYTALHDLIHKEWRTQNTGQTDANGRHSFRGFHGRYRITLRHGPVIHTREIALNRPTPGAAPKELLISL